MPIYLRKLFVHAYQSFIFNGILSERLREKTMKEPLNGDRILPYEDEKFGNRPIKMVEVNDTVFKRVESCDAYIMGLIPGYESELREGIESKILDEEGVKPEDFVIPEMPECSAKGTLRTLLAPVKEVDYDFNDERVLLNFFLFKGCYATSFLREIMKN